MATNVKRKKKAEVMSDDGSMTLTGHLKELRNRLIICAAVFVVGVIGFLAISDKLIDLLTAMAMNANYTFVFLAPQEKLMQYFRVSLIAAVIVTIPVALYQVYAFAKPGLKRSERFFFRLVLLFGLALFCVGVLFAYKVTLPFMLNFLVTLEGTDYITASISIESYINLCLTMFIIFGCVFEMPLVTIILAKMGIANPEIMKKGRGVAIVLIFLVAAIITPPDIVSQCFVAVPMCLLYFISIFLSGIFYKPKTDDDDEDEHEHHHHDHDEHDHDDHCCCGHHHDHDHDEDDDEHEHEHHHDHDEHDHEEHEHHHDHDGHCCCGHHHHDHHADEVFTSWGVETARKFTKAEVEHALTELDTGNYGMILRSKGIVDGGADGWLEFDYVPGEWEVRSRSADVGGKLVVIGSKLNETAIAQLFGC